VAEGWLVYKISQRSPKTQSSPAVRRGTSELRETACRNDRGELFFEGVDDGAARALWEGSQAARRRPAPLGRAGQEVGQLALAQCRQRGQGGAEPDAWAANKRFWTAGNSEASMAVGKVRRVSPQTTMRTGAAATPPIAPESISAKKAGERRSASSALARPPRCGW